MKATVVDVDLYGSTVILVRGPAERLEGWIGKYVAHTKHREKFLEILRKEPIKEADLGLTVYLESGTSLIWLPEDATVATFLHEVYHASSRMLSAKGIDHTQETEEVYAYLFEHIYRKVIKTKAVHYDESKKEKKR